MSRLLIILTIALFTAAVIKILWKLIHGEGAKPFVWSPIEGVTAEEGKLQFEMAKYFDKRLISKVFSVVMLIGLLVLSFVLLVYGLM